MFATLIALLLALFAGPVAGAGTVPLVQKPPAAVVRHGGQSPSAGPVVRVPTPKVSAPTDVPEAPHPATVAAPTECPEHPQMSDDPAYANCPLPAVEP